MQVTFAALRCRELLERGELEEARSELAIAGRILSELGSLPVGEESGREIDRARGEHAKLEIRLHRAQLAGPSRGGAS